MQFPLPEYENDIREKPVKRCLRICCDIDHTVAFSSCFGDLRDYPNAKPDSQLIEILNQYYDRGNVVIYYTARGMRTYNNDIAAIEANVRPVVENWLARNGARYTELILGKPWADVYIDDKAIRPVEVKEMHKDFKW